MRRSRLPPSVSGCIERGEPGEDGRCEVAHTAITYVIGPDGHVLRELPFGVTADEIASVVEVTLCDLT